MRLCRIGDRIVCLLKVKERTPVGVLFYFGNLSDIVVVGEGVKAVAKSGFKCSSVQVFKCSR